MCVCVRVVGVWSGHVCVCVCVYACSVCVEVVWVCVHMYACVCAYVCVHVHVHGCMCGGGGVYVSKSHSTGSVSTIIHSPVLCLAFLDLTPSSTKEKSLAGG